MKRLQLHAMLKVANVIHKNINNKKSDLFISIRSPSQWQLSGSCLPLLRPVVYISANASWHTNQNKVRWKIRDSCYNCQITNKTYCDWVATESCSVVICIVKNSEELKGPSRRNN